MAVSIDGVTGSLVVLGQKLFPLGLSDPPPFGRSAPSGVDSWAEIHSAGTNFIRSGRSDWNLAHIDEQLGEERGRMDHAASRHLMCWPRLTEAAGNLPTTANSPAEQLLVRIVNGLKDHPALGAWKGVDEPANPNRPAPVAAAGLVRGLLTGPISRPTSVPSTSPSTKLSKTDRTGITSDGLGNRSRARHADAWNPSRTFRSRP
jgi:hypothetical protein